MIIFLVSSVAVAVKATTGTFGPAKDRSSPMHPYIGLYAAFLETASGFPLKKMYEYNKMLDNL